MESTHGFYSYVDESKPKWEQITIPGQTELNPEVAEVKIHSRKPLTKFERNKLLVPYRKSPMKKVCVV